MIFFEIFAAILSIMGSYHLKSSEYNDRFKSLMLFQIANLLTMIIAYKYQAYGIFLLNIIFSYFNFRGFLSLGKDTKLLKNDKRISKFIFSIFIFTIFSLFFNNFTFNDLFVYISKNKMESFGVLFALLGSYIINKGFELDKKINLYQANLVAGIGIGYILGDLFLLKTAIEKEMYPFAIQTFVFIILSIKNLYNINLSYKRQFNLIEAFYFYFIKNIKYYIKI